MNARSADSAALRTFAQRLLKPGESIDFDPTDGLSLAEAEVVALFFNPSLRHARAEAAVAQASLRDVGRWEDPSLGIDVERVLENVDDRWVIGGTLNFTIPISGRAAVQREQREFEADAARLRLAEQEQTTIFELRVLWIEWSAHAERVAALRKCIKELSLLSEIGQALAQAGELAPLDARAMRVEQIQRSVELLAAESSEQEASMRLWSLMGLLPDAGVRLLPSLSVSAPANLSPQTHPRFLQAQAALQIAEREYEIEVRKQIPDLVVGAGYGVDQGESRLLVNGLFPLPIWNANREAIARSRAKRDAAHASLGATLESLAAELAVASHAHRSAEVRHRLIIDELVPLADEQAAEAARLAAAGEADTLLILDAAQRQLSARIAVIDATRDRAAAAIRLGTFRAGYGSTISGSAAPVSEEPQP